MKQLYFLCLYVCLLLLQSAQANEEAIPTDTGLAILSRNVRVIGAVDVGSFNTVRYTHNSTEPFKVYLDPCDGNPELYIRRGREPPTLDSYSYISINSHGTDFVQVTEGPGEYTIGIYGGTAANFSLLVTEKERQRVKLQSPKLLLTDISSSKVELLWEPVESFDTTDPWTYGVYLYQESSEPPPRESRLATTCGMELHGVIKSPGSLVKKGERYLYSATVNLSNKGATYWINVGAWLRENDLISVAYQPALFRALDFMTIRLDNTYTGRVGKGEYNYFRLHTDFIKEDPASIKDNYYREPEQKLTFFLSSIEGDADLFISINYGPPSFESYDLSSEGLQSDYITSDVHDSSTTFFISVYGKEATKYTLTTRLSTNDNFNKETGEARSSTESGKDCSVLSVLFDVLMLIIDFLLD